MKIKKKTLLTIQSILIFILILFLLIFVLNIDSFLKRYPERNASNQDITITENTSSKIVVTLADNIVDGDRIISQFEQKYSGIDIQYVEMPFSHHERYNYILSAFMTGDKTPDIIGADIVWLDKFIENDWIFDMSNFYDKTERNHINDFNSGFNYEDIYYGVPETACTLVLLYRKDIIENAPDTLSGLLNSSNILKEKYGLKYGLLWNGNNDSDLTVLLMSLMLSNKNAGTDITYSSDDIKNSVNFLKESLQKGAAPNEVLYMTEYDVIEKFADGESAFAICNTEYLPYLSSLKNFKEKFGVVEIPGTEKLDGKASMILPKSLVINKLSQNKEAAVEFIKYYTSEKTQMDLLMNNNQLPTIHELYKSPNITQKMPLITKMSDIFDRSISVEQVVHDTKYSLEISDYIFKILSETAGADDCIKNISEILGRE